MKFGTTVLKAALSWAISVGTSLQAQDVGARPPLYKPPGCTDCTLLAARVAVLGTEGDDVEFTHDYIDIARDRLGRIIAGPLSGYSKVGVFSPTGKLIKVIGRDGAGPGEFRTVGSIGVSLSDSLFIYDVSQRRMNVFDPTLVFRRSFLFQPHRRTVLGKSGTIFGLGDFRSPSTVGFALHEYSDRDGSRQSSFDEDSTMYGQETRVALEGRIIATNRTGELFVLQSEPMRIDHYVRNVKTNTISYQPSWLPYPTPEYRSRPGRPGTKELYAEPPVLLEPQPKPRYLRVDSDNTVWISGITEAPNWRGRPNPHEPPRRESKSGGSQTDPAKAFDTYSGWYRSVIDVVDQGTGKLLGRTRLPFPVAILLGNGYVAGMHTNAEGAFIVEIWRVALPSSRSK